MKTATKIIQTFQELNPEENQRLGELVNGKANERIDIEKVLHLAHELTEQEKRIFAKLAEMPFRYTPVSFPDLLFRKEIRRLGKEGAAQRKILYHAIVALTADIHLAFDMDLDVLLEKRDESIAKFGKWHTFWAAFFHPRQEEAKSPIQEALDELAAYKMGLPEGELSKEKEITGKRFSEKKDKDSILKTVEESLKNEKAKRIELEKALSKQQRDQSLLEKKLSKKSQEFDLLEKKYQVIAEELQEATEKYKELQQAHKKEIFGLKQEYEQATKEKKVNGSSLSPYDSLREELDSLQQKADQFKLQNQLMQEENTRLRAEQANLNDSNLGLCRKVEELKSQLAERQAAALDDSDLSNQMMTLIQRMNQEIATISTQALSRSASSETKRLKRSEIRRLLDLSEQMEDFLADYEGDEDERDENERDEVKRDEVKRDTISSVGNVIESRLAAEEFDELAEDLQEEWAEGGKAKGEPALHSSLVEFLDTLERVEKEGIPGTFYRSEWGGWIQLESGESVTLSEPEVLEHDLKHGAGLHYKPDDRGKHQITIAFQGDDQEGPIDQYFGFISLGNYHKWYCVDGNDPDAKFLIDDRDISRVPMLDQAPCFFNVIKGGTTARISRIYSENSSLIKKPKKGIKAKTKKPEAVLSRERVEPYLEGCKIVIVGGLRKWFEEIVEETGAELIHNDGSSPHRIYPELGKANALILHLESNSHNASWGSVEVAKGNDIPIYKLSGSKSSLKALLWEKRDVLKRSG